MTVSMPINSIEVDDIYFKTAGINLQQPQTLIGRVRKIAVEKGRPSTCHLISGRSQVPTCAGVPESDHSGVPPVKMRWLVD